MDEINEKTKDEIIRRMWLRIDAEFRRRNFKISSFIKEQKLPITAAPVYKAIKEAKEYFSCEDKDSYEDHPDNSGISRIIILADALKIPFDSFFSFLFSQNDKREAEDFLRLFDFQIIKRIMFLMPRLSNKQKESVKAEILSYLS